LALRDGGEHGDAVALTVDRDQRMPGRGAYVCGGECLRRAAARGRLRASFRRAVSIDAQTVESVG
jgi:predicted RNA-binding protein YlxR (DUF448 family)